MPCGDGGWGEAHRIYATSEELRIKTERLDNVTLLLCELCGKLEKANILTVYGTKDLLRWWAAHKKIDLKRIAKEKLQAAQEAAIKQLLTKEEQEALFTEQERNILGL